MGNKGSMVSLLMSEGNQPDAPGDQQKVCIDEKSQGPIGHLLYDWTVGMLAKFLPFNSKNDAVKAQPDNEPTVVEGTEEPPEQEGEYQEGSDDVVQELTEDTSESGSDKVMDIKQLIEEAQTDSETDDIDDIEEEDDDEEVLDANPRKDLGNTGIMKARVRSHELLRPPPSYRSNRFKKPERPRTIKFDDTAVLLDAASEGDVEEVNRMLTQLRVDVNICNEKGITALHRAAGFGQADMIQLLLSKNANVNVVDIDQWTPLHNAASAGALESVQRLLLSDANVEAKTDTGETAADLTEVPEILRYLSKTLQTKLQSSTVKALYNFVPDPDAPDELEFHTGDTLKILNRDDPDWWLAELNGRQGYIPRGWVQ